MHRICKLLFILLVVISSSLTAQTTYYVSSSTGNDNNSGTSSGSAWQSLSKVNALSPQPGDQILFKRGDTWEGALTVTESGTSGNPVVYGAFGTGDKPGIYNSRVITGWKLHSGNIYKATVNEPISQLFLNGIRMQLARYPNAGYFTVNSVGGSTTLTSTDLNSSINYTNSTWIGRTTAYTMYARKVTSSDGQTLTIDSSPFGSLGSGEGFFLCDKLEFLDQAGEWYFDASTNTVYLWTPTGSSPSNDEVRGSVNDNGISITSASYVTIVNLGIYHSGVHGILIDHGDHMTISGNDIVCPDLVGIHVLEGAIGANLLNNYICQANGGGIRCYSSNAVITGNTIEETGQLENINKSTYSTSDNFGTGIFSRGDHPVITYNRILNSGYDGINWKGTDGDISFNYINGACQVLDDGGGIYTYNGSDRTQAGSAGSKVTYNIVLNVTGNRKGYTKSYDAGHGIYMDNSIHDINIKYNTVHGCFTGVFLHDNGRNSIQYNQLSNCMIGFLTALEFQDSYWHYNTVYAYDRDGDFVWWQDSHQLMVKTDGAVSAYDYNTYIDHYHADNTFNKTDNFDGWKSSTGQDAHSTFDGSTLNPGETEEFFYNDSAATKVFDLGTTVYLDMDGNQVTDSITLAPFTSRLLIRTGGSGLAPLFTFEHHFINDSLPTGWVNGVQTLADYDNDGDLDMTVGSMPKGLFLFVNNDTAWATVKIGDVPYTSLGAAPLDVDNDGYIDIVSAGVWYRNEGNYHFSMYRYDPSFKTEKEEKKKLELHDLIAADIDGDGKTDILTQGQDIGFFWYSTNSVPGKVWKRTVIDPEHTSYKPKIHGGFSPGGVGDLDGDGDMDIFNAVAWFKNEGNGKTWVKHPFDFPELFTGALPYGKSTRSIITDSDGDGDNDIVFTECDDVHAKAGIIENLNRDGSKWKLTLLPLKAEGLRCSLHSLAIGDFNRDGHMDIITVDQEDMMAQDTTLHSSRWYIFTNVGNGWEEQVLFDNGLGGHDIIPGDVDGDGDIDLVSKVWNPWKKSANKGLSHADFIENLTIK